MIIREKIVLDGAGNTRDLGNISFGGKKIKDGLLIRSGNLASLSERDIDILKNKYKVKAVIDLRTDLEAKEAPDIVLKGAKYYRLTPLTESAMGVTHEKATGLELFTNGIDIKTDPDTYMCKMYDKFLFSEHGMSEYRKFFDILLETDGCVLWHCSAGKDRAGMAAALAELALGVDEETIAEDFMLTNFFTEKEREEKLEMFLTYPGAKAIRDYIYALLSVSEKYIEHVIGRMKNDFGSVEGYFENGIGLTADEINTLRNKYTESIN